MTADNRESEEGGDLIFLTEAVASLSTPGLKLPLLLAAVMLPAANFLILANLPTRESPDHGPYLVAFAAIVTVYTALSVAILRTLNASSRPAWKPDRSAGAYGLFVLGSIAIGLFADWLIAPSTILSALANKILSALVIVPIAPWIVAVAVQRPLAWRPAPWVQRQRSWLPALFLWNS
jgi:hypothetical protein